jgi:hypothetical protein
MKEAKPGDTYASCRLISFAIGLTKVSRRIALQFVGSAENMPAGRAWIGHCGLASIGYGVPRIRQCISEEDVAYQHTFKMSGALSEVLDCPSYFFHRDAGRAARILAADTSIAFHEEGKAVSRKTEAVSCAGIDQLVWRAGEDMRPGMEPNAKQKRD